MRTHSIVAVVAVAALTACSKPADQTPTPQPGQTASQATPPAAQTAQPGTQQAQQGAQQMAQGMQQVAQGLAQMAQNANGGQTVKPVEFQTLIGALPNLSGWTRSEPVGQQLSFPFAISNAEARYTKGAMGVKVTITDSAFNQLVMAPLSMVFTSGYSEKTATGYKKSATVGGSPALEEWDSADKSGSLAVVVNKRFVVQADGSNLDNMDSLRAVVEKIDLNKLGK